MNQLSRRAKHETDFHSHSHFSDGSDSPTQIVEVAVQSGLKEIALTDHDTIDGLVEASKRSKELGLKFIPGIELSVRYEDTRLLHLLGLNIDIDVPEFSRLYLAYRERREKALEAVFLALKLKGIELTYDALKPYGFGKSLDRQAVAKWLMEKDYAPSIPRAWIDILDDITYEQDEILSISEAIEMIHAAHGKVYLAHIHKDIGMLGYSDDDITVRIGHLKTMGLDGIEARYPSFTEADKKLIAKLVERYQLETCGGSDYHGSYRKEVKLGD
jgi:3',5'-nucleoside bisphosphate phosphatase